MTVNAALSFTQNAITPGPGISMVGVAALPVTLASVVTGGAISHTFEMLDVPLNSLVPTGIIYSGPLNTCQFIPDAPPGCYRVRLSVQGGDGSVRQQIRNFAVPTAVGGLVLPSFKATAAELNFPGNTEGWEQILNEWLLYLLAASAADDHKVLASAADTTPGFLSPKLAAGTNITLTLLNPGLNETVEITAAGTPLGSANPLDLGVTAPGTAAAGSHEDHVHAHGNQAGGPLHALATLIAAGFMSPADKAAIASAVAMNQILVYPNNKSEFALYGYQTFGDDLNAAWASIPRADVGISPDHDYRQMCNDWVVVIPAGIYAPASTSLAIRGTTVTGVARILDFGYTGAEVVGQAVTGPGIPPGTTIASVAQIAGYFSPAVSYTLGSDVLTGIASTATMFVGQIVYSGGGALTLPYCRVTAILGPNSVRVNALATATLVASMTALATISAGLSAAPTLDNTDVAFSVSMPLTITGTTNGTAVLTGVSYVCNEMVGMAITGTNIPPATTVASITYNATTNQGTITLSQPTTGSSAGTFYLDLPWAFYLDLNRRKVTNLCVGPVNLGKATSGVMQGAQFWAPQPGSDHFIDLVIQPAFNSVIYGMRPGLGWFGGWSAHGEASTTHDAYRDKTRLTGTIVILDTLGLGSVPSQSHGWADIEIFGNPKRVIYSQQVGTTVLGSATVTALTSTAGLFPGQAVTGVGIAANTSIQSIASPSSVVLTKPATAGGAPTLTFAPTVLSVHSYMTAASHFLSFWKARVRGTLNVPGFAELAHAVHTNFAFVNVKQYCHIEQCSMQRGMVWTANSTNFDVPGFYDCQIVSNAAFNGVAAAPLRVDASTNYWLKQAGAVIGSGTPKLLLGDPTCAAVALTGQLATLPSTGLFTPSTDGTYRVSVYASCTVVGAAGTVTPSISWTDDTTAQSLALPALPLTVLGGYVQQTIFVKAKTATAISYAALVAGVVGAPTYSLYVTVEPVT